MSTRERWIVYPILFLTLGIAMRDKILPPARIGGFGTKLEAGEIDVRRLRCGEFQAGKGICNQLESGRSECRELFVVGPNGRPAIVALADPKSHNGVLETFTADGKPLVQLQSSEAGGIIMTFGSSGRVLVIGENGQPPPKNVQPQPRPKVQIPGKGQAETARRQEPEPEPIGTCSANKRLPPCV